MVEIVKKESEKKQMTFDDATKLVLELINEMAKVNIDLTVSLLAFKQHELLSWYNEHAKQVAVESEKQVEDKENEVPEEEQAEVEEKKPTPMPIVPKPKAYKKEMPIVTKKPYMPKESSDVNWDD